MNQPEVEVDDLAADRSSTSTADAATTGKAPVPVVKKQHILQRRLQTRISESRMLEVLDRQLQKDRAKTAQRRPRDSNQDDVDDEDEDELVCVSTMVAVAPSATTADDDYAKRVCGVLKTVRTMNRQRRTSENQSDDAKSFAPSRRTAAS